MNNHKKIALYIIIAGIFGAFLGSIISGTGVRALNFGDVFRNLIKVPGVEQPNQASVKSNAVPYIPTVDYEEKIINAVQKSDPAVVSIVISKDVPILENCAADPFSGAPDEFKQFLGDVPQFTQPCKKGTKKREVGGGSGFILDSDGTIVTNKHVVSDEKSSYTVFTNDGKKYDAKVLARDPIVDFAVIKIDAVGLPTLPIGDSDSIKLGQTAIAIGNALGEFRNTVSVGVVSGLKRNVTAGSGGGSTETIEGVIQTDAAINPGNSGGPLLNLKGEVIGINTAVATGAQNIGFAIPINQVKRGIRSIHQTGRIIVPYVGVSYIMLNDEVAAEEKITVKDGALIKSKDKSPAILKNSPAEKAGLKAGDIIIEVNGEKISADHALGALVQKYSVGDTIDLRVKRGSETLDFKVTLEERKF